MVFLKLRSQKTVQFWKQFVCSEYSCLFRPNKGYCPMYNQKLMKRENSFYLRGFSEVRFKSFKKRVKTCAICQLYRVNTFNQTFMVYLEVLSERALFSVYCFFQFNPIRIFFSSFSFLVA